MMKKLMSPIASSLHSKDLANTFAIAQAARAHDFSSLWNVSGKEA